MRIWDRAASAKALIQEEDGVSGQWEWGDEEQGAGRARPVGDGGLHSKSSREQLLKGSEEGTDEI